MSEEGTSQQFIEFDPEERGFSTLLSVGAFNDFWANQDGWEDQPDGTKRREIIVVEGRKKPWGDNKVVALRDKNDNLSLAIEFPDLGKRFVVKCTKEDM